MEIREGDALETLSVDLPEAIDLLLLDGAKALYPEILDLVEARLKPGALIVADNADYAPDYLSRCAHPGVATSPSHSRRTWALNTARLNSVVGGPCATTALAHQSETITAETMR